MSFSGGLAANASQATCASQFGETRSRAATAANCGESVTTVFMNADSAAVVKLDKIKMV